MLFQRIKGHERPLEDESLQAHIKAAFSVLEDMKKQTLESKTKAAKIRHVAEALQESMGK